MADLLIVQRKTWHGAPDFSRFRMAAGL